MRRHKLGDNIISQSTIIAWGPVPIRDSDRKLQLARCFGCVFKSEILTRDF